MYFPHPHPAESGGRVRTRSHHERDQGGEEIVGSSSGNSENLERSGIDAAPSGGDAGIASSSSAAGDLNHVVIDTSTASSSFCPAIIAPTAAPSALAAAAAAFNPAAARGAGGGDSFLGFGFDSPPKDVWEQQEGRGGGGRERAPSSDNVDMGGGCDLGWGGLDADADMTGSRERRRDGEGEEEEEQEGEGYAFDAEGRPSSVPDIDPLWSYEGAVGGQTRSARARSSSFYEGDDEETMACINGETLVKKSSSGSSSIADPNDPCRYGSLAYSSSGDFSNSADLDALLRPRDNSSGMTASQAAAAKSAAVVVAAAAAAAGGGEVGGAPIPLTPAAARRRQLGKRELDALEAGLKAPPPGGRKYSSGDDRVLSSDSDQGSEDEDDGGGYYEDVEEEAFYSREQDIEAFYAAEEERISSIEHNYGDGSGLAAPGSPPLQMELPGPLAHDGVDPARCSDGEDGSGMMMSASAGSGSSGSPPSLGGGHVFPPGVDPFLSVTGSDGSGSGGLPLSPRAVMISSGMATETATAAAAAAFPMAVPLSLPPPHSPPRPRVSLVAGDGDGNELDSPGMNIPSPRHPPPVLWPAAEGDAPPAVVATVPPEAEARSLTCEPGAESPSSLCSPPAMLASLSLSAAPPSPRPQPSIDDEVSLQSLVASPPAPPPAQLAPLPPPPEPLAPSPPRPPTPDAPSSEAPSPSDDDPSRGGTSRESGPVGAGEAGSRSGGGQVNLLMPPPPPPPVLRSGASYGSNGSGSGSGTGCRIGPAGPGSGSFGSGGSAGGFGANYRSNPSGCFNSGGFGGGGGGISRLTGPGGPFGSNRPGAGGGYQGARARYRSGGGGGNGRSNLYGSAPGTLGDGSARRDHVLRGSSTVQGFLSVGGGSRNFGGRRGHGGAQQAKKIKLLMLGDSGVGKSSLMDRFTEDYFNVTTVQTLGVDFKLKTIVINDEEVDLQVWDTAGQQKFHKITQAYYRGSHGIVLVYDISDPETLGNTAYWMKSIRDTAGSNRVQICLVGNKVDLRQEACAQDGRQAGNMVDTSAGRKVAEEFGAEYFECSAKTGCMVEEAFTTTATKAYEAHLVKPSTPSSKSRRRLGRRRHNRNASMGSDKDRPPRSDASWSTSSSLSGVESSADRLDNARMRQSAMEAGSEISVVTHTSVVSSLPGGAAGGQHQRPMSFPSHSVGTPPTASCSSPCPTPFGQSNMVTTPPRGSFRGGQQQQRPQPSEVAVRQQPSPPSAAGRREREQQQQEHQIRELVPPLSALSPKTAAAALGMGAGKGAAEKAAGEDSPTGTGTMSPLPGQQRSIGRSSSLGDMESYFGTTLTSSPKGSDTDSSADGGRRSGAARRRADTGGLFGLFGGGGAGAGAGAAGFSTSGGGSFSSSGSGDGDDHSGSANRGSGGLGVAEIIARQRQRSSPRPTAGPGPWGDDPPPPAVSRMKGKKPPRVPRMKRMASGDSDGGGARGRGGKNVCKVS